MLAAEARLRHGRDIARVMKRGRYGSSGTLLVKVLPTGGSESRAVVVVSKKVSKKAVVRNRIRRRVGGVVAELWQTVQGGYDIVVTVREDLSEASAAEVRKAVERALDRAGVRSTT